jgi:hypothetical protein
VQCATLPSTALSTYTDLLFSLNFSNLFPKKKKQEREEQWSGERDIYLAAAEQHWIEGF